MPASTMQPPSGVAPAFRFAVVIELWYPPRADMNLCRDPDLRTLLEVHTAYSFLNDAQ